MPTQYTPLLGFAQPQTGELTNTWGTVVNDSVTQLVEDSVAGVATASVTGGDWTLSDTGSGVSNEARCAIIIPTGTPGVSRNVIAPSRSKAYVVINESDAAIVFKGAGPPPTTGVTIPANDRALVAWDGVDFVRVGASAGGSNTQVQYNNSGNLGGSASFTFNSGTGAVTATSFSGSGAGLTSLDAGNISAGTLPVARGGTGLSSFTANRVFYSSSTSAIGSSANLTFDGTTLTADTVTAKLKAYSEAVTTATVSTATYNLDTSLTNIFDITLGNNVTFTFTNPPTSGISRSVTVILRQDATGNRTATFTNAYYSNGLAPTLSTGANDIDVLTFFTVNGGTFWFGTFAMADVS